MKGIELDILFHSDESFELNKLGIDKGDYELKKMTFFSINAIAVSKDFENKGYSVVYSNGDAFVCTDSYETLKTKLSTAL
jgi:hypothetical protein